MKRNINQYLIFACLFLSTGNIYSAATFQQKIHLNTNVAHINTAIPFKVDCSNCTQITKQDDYTYYITYNAPTSTTENYITFTYFYGDEHSNCIYNARVIFDLMPNGEFFSNYNMPSTLDIKSTSNACPSKVALFANTKNNVTNLNIDW